MPKKNQKKEEKKPELQIVDEQKQPCLRGLQKKVRNINKKLLEIADLEGKKGLNPEQIEKVERKQRLVEQKQKFIEFINIYKDILAENANSVRNYQLNQLKQIATVLAARQYGAHHHQPPNAQLDILVKLLSSPSSIDISLNERVTQITEQLVKVANNTKLKQKYLKFAAQNPDKTLGIEKMSNQPQPRSNKSEEQHKQVIEDLDEQLHEVNQKTGQQPVIVEPHVNEEKQEQPSLKQENQPQSTPSGHVDQNYQVLEPADQKTQSKAEQKTEQNPEKNKKRTRYNNKDGDKQVRRQGDQEGRRGRRQNYNRGQRKQGQGQYNGGQNERKPRNFRPKYTPKDKQAQIKKQKSSQSSSQSEQEVRQFKREQKKKLQDDGFIFVAPKTKAKAQTKEQKQWHNHQHGRKNLHHKQSHHDAQQQQPAK